MISVPMLCRSQSTKSCRAEHAGFGSSPRNLRCALQYNEKYIDVLKHAPCEIAHALPMHIHPATCMMHFHLLSCREHVHMYVNATCDSPSTHCHATFSVVLGLPQIHFRLLLHPTTNTHKHPPFVQAGAYGAHLFGYLTTCWNCCIPTLAFP